MRATSNVANFICTADSRVGFGHLRRCLAIARLLQARTVPVSFSGRLDEAALALIRRELPTADIVQNPILPGSAIVDCMFDPEDMDAYDVGFLQEVRNLGVHTALLTSSIHVPPDLPVDLVIGHMLGEVSSTSYDLRRGLAWAPVSPEAGAFRRLERQQPMEVERVLLAFGNYYDPTGLFLALDALESAPCEMEVQVLLPPALRVHEAEIRRRGRNLNLVVLTDVPTVFPLLDRSDLLIGSYGNLTFEALCLGVPVVIVAIKEFMALYAARLEAEGCLVLAGEARNLKPEHLADRLRALDQVRRASLATVGQRLVDGLGLRRTADLLNAWMNGPCLEASRNGDCCHEHPPHPSSVCQPKSRPLLK
jgi:spore coat polysaccharide biosynthesis predicted glycosyltransferase SpsG